MTMRRFPVLIAAALLACGGAAAQDTATILAPDARGDRIPDFSEAGFGRVGEAIPDVPVVARVPSGGGAEIQAALDAVARRPIGRNGLRGAVLLGPGTYRLAVPLRITASGVALRGVKGRTTLVPAGPLERYVEIVGSGKRARAGKPAAVLGTVPVGARTIAVGSTAGLAVGTMVIVERPFTAAWIHKLGMDALPPRRDGGKVVQWKPGSGIRFERRIVAIRGDRVTLDAPVTDRIEPSDGATIWPYAYAGRIDRAGVENIAIRGSTDPAAPRATAITLDRITNGWVRDVTIDSVTCFVNVDDGASDVTVERVSGSNAALPEPGVPPAIFNVSGQRVLVQDTRFQGVQAQVWAVQARAPGPTVFRNSEATGTKLSAGPHQRWATGTLYENLRITGSLVARNRMSLGTGHGWTGGTQVFWNDVADTIWVEQAPGARNWAVGSTGTVRTSERPAGAIVSPGKAVAPKSLFDAQVAAALGR